VPQDDRRGREISHVHSAFHWNANRVSGCNAPAPEGSWGIARTGWRDGGNGTQASRRSRGEVATLKPGGIRASRVRKKPAKKPSDAVRLALGRDVD
jgi:hypothetical protein